jgi:quercetin dioxygenase-like cupin family protein
MAQVISQTNARNLGLPGRKSLEIISGEMGADAVTLRLVEIPVAKPGESLRGPHYHTNYEECIYVLSGQGCTETDADKYPLRAGDTILIPSGEAHVTRNTGTESLMLLCFFPTAQVTNLERNQN